MKLKLELTHMDGTEQQFRKHYFKSEQSSANFSVLNQIVNIFIFASRMVSVGDCLLCCGEKNTAIPNVEAYACPVPRLVLFAKTGSGLDLACRFQCQEQESRLKGSGKTSLAPFTYWVSIGLAYGVLTTLY